MYNVAATAPGTGCHAHAERVIFFNIVEHADGECRGPVPIYTHLQMRLIETFSTPPSDSVQPSVLAVGRGRKVVKIDLDVALPNPMTLPPASVTVRLV